MNCAEAKKIDLVSYLAELGYFPQRISGNDYYYISPFRDEKHASFHVNRKRNVWYDHGGNNDGGSIIDFGIRHHHCKVSEFLKRLERFVSFLPKILLRYAHSTSNPK